MKKILARPKKNSYKEFDDEKKFLRLENSPPPYNFSNGPSLILVRAGEFRNTRLPPAVNKYPSPFDVVLSNSS